MRKPVESVTKVDSGQSNLIPENTLALINNTATTRNSSQWKRPDVSRERRAALSESPALYFDPDRGLGTDDRPGDAKGELPAWHVFGAGGRAFPRRTFAHIELTSGMATLLIDYSLEVIASDKTLQKCRGNKTRVWERITDKGMRMMYDSIEANISIGLMKELTIRIVKRKLSMTGIFIVPVPPI